MFCQNIPVLAGLNVLNALTLEADGLECACSHDFCRQFEFRNPGWPRHRIRTAANWAQHSVSTKRSQVAETRRWFSLMASWAVSLPCTTLTALDMHSVLHGIIRGARRLAARRPPLTAPSRAACGVPPCRRPCGPVATFTTSHNPFDFDSAGSRKNRLLARMEMSVDEADEPM